MEYLMDNNKLIILFEHITPV